ncbi:MULTISPECIES: BPSL0761 family protein [Pseudomonadaceae]|uniref:BPSL0761 family protein n=1 Tax=Pseudomonadaceae TaxID=135621 RepID=UPI001239615C|nr:MULTISPECIES: BPSL0761 family protein [Pseudomonadaceae]
MTTPYERFRSLIQVESLLQEISNDEALPEFLRNYATGILRHYPSGPEIRWQIDLDARCRKELAVLADKHGPLHPALVAWMFSEPMRHQDIRFPE